MPKGFPKVQTAQCVGDFSPTRPDLQAILTRENNPVKEIHRRINL